MFTINSGRGYFVIGTQDFRDCGPLVFQRCPRILISVCLRSTFFACWRRYKRALPLLQDNLNFLEEAECALCDHD
ncbi:hypothetical protein CEXT_598011 [Caerostris extrusa]|uniref:Uncharacterized protein n=1 Tax=Caerostris extrusa TaxID=172846 RepID=A0AAV4NS24_CAEEX|nr:hypothetical protein CEXT_598011 [Caerostris extrusa]